MLKHVTATCGLNFCLETNVRILFWAYGIPPILALEICDDGRGLPANKQDKGAGLGLVSMRERAAELGGTCLIEQASQGGTRVFVRLPCMPITEARR